MQSITADLVLQAVKAYWAEYRVPPAMRTVQTAAGFRTPSAVLYWYRQLAGRGLLVISSGKPVPIEIWKILGDLSNE